MDSGTRAGLGMDSGNRADSGLGSRVGATTLGGSAAEVATSGGTKVVCVAQTHRMAASITGRTESTLSISETDGAVPGELE